MDSREVRWYRNFDQPSPLLKQAPAVVAFALALAVMFLVPGLPPIDTLPMLVAGALIAVATVFAAVLTVRGHLQGSLVLLIPIVDFVAFAFFRAATGAGQSLFATLVLIPIAWLATAPGVRQVAAVFVMSAAMVFIPYLRNPPETSADLLRGVIVPLIYAAVAAVINELSRQQRARIEQAERLAAERTVALRENEAMLAQLRESEARYRTLLESHESLWAAITAQAVIATDCDGVVSAWNPGAERMLGVSEADAVNHVTIERFLPPAALSALAGTPASVTASGTRALFELANSGETLDEELEIRTATGARLPARITVTRRNDGAGNQQGYLLVVTDETRQAEVARMKDQFVGMISHELRTPLSAIIGFLDLLRNDPEQPLTEQQVDFVDIIERNAQRLLALVGDLLFTAQVESGRFPITPHHLDIYTSLRLAAESARPGAERESVALELAVPEEPLIILADGGRIGQALDNLISNAVKFTPPGGRVTVSGRLTDGSVVLSVSDTGIGIPAAEQADLFSRFFRASTATQNAIPGVGLGLNITQAIAVAHGGSISVSSVEGEGTTFELRLPLAPPTQAVPVVPESSAA
ncbi:PAS domain S-box-containing protein [Leucobacter komagatae]|uniref:histidine kinase n=1 Tax=Leucobacter komagatae TaxID=55969 RepID=A0A542Y6P6_9MICO|nr:ATP-binding protein [Leucobacter komagatae]TQL43770.1 PAS domain S-box-containing protein [Leucobacter komagatae]